MFVLLHKADKLLIGQVLDDVQRDFGVGFLILFGVREIPSGSSKPERQDLSEVPTFQLEWSALRTLLRRRTIFPLFLQGFFGVFPFNVIEFWFFTYLGCERGYDETTIFMTMAAAAITMSIGTVVGGAASAPLLVGLLSSMIGLNSALLLVSVGTLLICALFLLIVIILVPQDVEVLRQEMCQRAGAVAGHS